MPSCSRMPRPASPTARVGAAPDLAAAVDYARTVGQASLGELPFHRRALILKALAQALTEAKDDLYAISAATGATARDSMIDVDGGIGVLFTYSSKGRRELPNATTLVDGAPEGLSRDGSFGGQHLWSRLTGVAFQVNAFNFPVWGMLEKFAPAFLAGRPDRSSSPRRRPRRSPRPAVRVMVDSGLLPDGSLQLVTGSVHGFLDQLDARDAVGFTGSRRRDGCCAATTPSSSGASRYDRGRLGQRRDPRSRRRRPAPPSSTRSSHPSSPR